MNLRFASGLIVMVMLPSATFAQFDIQGHRGCRGLMPENTIPAFIRAVTLGVTTLELDVVITADSQVVVSHEPYMSSEICLDPEGRVIPAGEEQTHNIYRMNLSRVQSYSCGALRQARFPEREVMQVYKPTLREVFDTVESYLTSKGLPPVKYNIETKSAPAGDHRFHPPPDTFADLVMEVIVSAQVQSRCMIQSFDVRTLQHLKAHYTGVPLALLVEDVKGIGHPIRQLGFIPDVYSPHFRLLTAKSIARLHEKGMRVIPWTVNEPRDMIRLIRMGVDGLITDYPDRLINLLKL